MNVPSHIAMVADGNVTVHTRCCGTDMVVPATVSQVARWRHGQYIQDAMPDLGSTQRELLISGVCGPCWDKLFSDG